MQVKLLILILAAVAISGCQAEKERPAPGRCFQNTDCPDGFRCAETYCEDIYFPRQDIKPY